MYTFFLIYFFARISYTLGRLLLINNLWRRRQRQRAQKIRGLLLLLLLHCDSGDRRFTPLLFLKNCAFRMIVCVSHTFFRQTRFVIWSHSRIRTSFDYLVSVVHYCTNTYVHLTWSVFAVAGSQETWAIYMIRCVSYLWRLYTYIPLASRK